MLVCGSGAGVAVAANKIDGIRAAMAHDTYTAAQCVEHDACNVLALGARVIGPVIAAELVTAFAGADFSGEERHARRLAKVDEIERERARGRALRGALSPADRRDRVRWAWKGRGSWSGRRFRAASGDRRSGLTGSALFAYDALLR